MSYFFFILPDCSGLKHFRIDPPQAKTLYPGSSTPFYPNLALLAHVNSIINRVMIAFFLRRGKEILWAGLSAGNWLQEKTAQVLSKTRKRSLKSGTFRNFCTSTSGVLEHKWRASFKLYCCYSNY